MADFLPRRDSAMVDWTRGFARGIQDDPAQYRLTVQQVADYAGLQQDYAQAYRASQLPMTRGVRTVMLKDNARKAVTRKTRVPGATGHCLRWL